MIVIATSLALDLNTKTSPGSILASCWSKLGSLPQLPTHGQPRACSVAARYKGRADDCAHN
jgi:hypothetical protein